MRSRLWPVLAGVIGLILTDVLGLRLRAAGGSVTTYAQDLAHPDQLGNDQRLFGAWSVAFGILALARAVVLLRRGSRSGASP